ncbi:DMT family transporter [Aspergillus brunneoviolaceus CBS 621.78]|uniref:Uncharacterized protein n=1 Tax=Aspergillus brunneoviolaceus CBS 621.78 TaxID=1450534 RepID=A0ACD1FTR3_9EURO|nr:hypothetical protein BO95DRAFT_375695 [Aspergillus brunneoviolaceus CBS 621.78]RAH40392.1 hypothetical protein BO95DRAFT_375695 [Aspergillus brunneoviolaceus CBS 621.78]
MEPSTSIPPTSGLTPGGRRTLGIALLLIVVFLWTASNFLASTIFADNTYSKPFFVTYVNTSIFILPLASIIAGRVFRLWRAGKLYRIRSVQSLLQHLDAHDGCLEGEGRRILDRAGLSSARLGLKETAKLSFQFCLLWANYFAMACLQYTTVGSTTILTSTSGVWTLIFGALIGVERFTPRKLLGVIASLIGIIIISRLDISAPSPSPSPTPDADPNPGGNRSTIPPKSPHEIALGDAMAAFSAVMYGVYTIVLKKQVGDESRVNMQLFFGLVGLLNMVLLWPGFLVLHALGVEPLAWPDSPRVWTIVWVNALASLLSDLCWAYAMLLTTPLVVTVGLSLTIPLSLVGQMVIQGQYASGAYWVGAAVVFGSFLVVNHESRGDVVDTQGNGAGEESGRGRTRGRGRGKTGASSGYEAISVVEEGDHRD